MPSPLVPLSLAVVSANEDRVGATVSMLIVLLSAAPVLPAASVALTVKVSLPWPMALMSALVSVYVQAPVLPAVTERTVVVSANVMSTRAPASVAPVMVTPAVAANSLALIASPADTLTSVTVGATVSTVIARVPAVLGLPAASLATALMVALPPAATSALLKVVVHVPLLAVTEWLAAPQVTSTLAPTSAVPLTGTPAAFSIVLTTLSVATALMAGAVGAVASMLVAAAVLKVPWLPPAFCTTAVKLWAPSLSAVPGVNVHVVPPTTALPKRVVPSYTRTTSSVANVPVTVPDKAGVVSFVRAAADTETVAVGTVALTVTAYAVPWVPALPAESSTCALKLCAALVRPTVPKVQVVPETVATPKRVEPS